MPAKTQKTKMPVGKMQFGIIVPSEIHRKAKHMAADSVPPKRISDVYADGISVLSDAKVAHQAPEHLSLLKKVTQNLPTEDWVYLEALADFLRGKPRPDQSAMLKLLLGKYLPAER